MTFTVLGFLSLKLFNKITTDNLMKNFLNRLKKQFLIFKPKTL